MCAEEEHCDMAAAKMVCRSDFVEVMCAEEEHCDTLAGFSKCQLKVEVMCAEEEHCDKRVLMGVTPVIKMSKSCVLKKSTATTPVAWQAPNLGACLKIGLDRSHVYLRSPSAEAQ